MKHPGAPADTPEADTETLVNQAICLLNTHGIRYQQFDGSYHIWIPYEADEPKVRAALATLQLDSLPIEVLKPDEVPLGFGFPKYSDQELLELWRSWKATQAGKESSHCEPKGQG